MSLGNGKRKNGDKGSNFSYELKSLMQLSNLSSLLADLITVTEDINEDAEILLVRDTANGDIIVQQIRIYDRLADVWTTSYQNLDGSDYVPVLPPAYEYLDSSTTLSQVIGADGLPHGGPEQKGFRVLGTDGVDDYQLSTDVDGRLQTDTALASNSTVTNKLNSDDPTNSEFAAANLLRRSLKVTNNSESPIYLKEGAVATTTSYTWIIEEGETVIIDDYNGKVDGSWFGINTLAGTGALITETTF